MSTAQLVAGAETGDLNEWDSAQIGANWTLVADATSKRTTGGAKGYHLTRTAAAGSVGAFMTTLVQGIGIWNNSRGAGGLISGVFPVRCRFYMKLVVWSGSSIQYLWRHTGLNVTTPVTQSLTLTGTRALQVNDNSGNHVNLTGSGWTGMVVGTWYRIECEVGVGGGSISAAVYAEQGTTVLAAASLVIGGSDIPATTSSIIFGCKTAFNANAALECYLDDFKMIDSTGGIAAYPGQGASLAPVFPTADVVSEFVATGSANHWANVDDWTNTADYNETPTTALYTGTCTTPFSLTVITDSAASFGATNNLVGKRARLTSGTGSGAIIAAIIANTGTTFTVAGGGFSPQATPDATTNYAVYKNEDRFDFTNYGGANTIMSVCLIWYSLDTVVGGANHFCGLINAGGTRDETNGQFATGAYTYRAMCCGVDPSNAAWTNANFNAAQVYYRHLIEITATRRFASLIILPEDNDGTAAAPPPTPGTIAGGFV